MILEAAGEHLKVNAPAGVLTEDLWDALIENKVSLLKLLIWEQRKLEEADKRGLFIRWSKEPATSHCTIHRRASGMR